MLRRIEAVGKHLWYRFETGEILHVHLGLIGRFATYPADAAPPPTPGTRLAWRADGHGAHVLYLAGATIVELVTPDEVRAVKARLGPDPLDRRADPAPFLAGLRRRSIPVGQALLDQSLIAGLGNVYRAELLFLAGIHPATPARDLEPSEGPLLWHLAVAELAVGLRTGRIVTVVRNGRRAGRGDPLDRRYAYKRGGRPCLRCGTAVQTWPLGGRNISHCPSCQPLRAAGDAAAGLQSPTW